MTKPTRARDTFEVTVEKIVHGGMGLARHRGKVVFVPFSVPGDRLRVRTSEEKKSFIRAEPVRLVRSGPGRVQPACPHFGRCGGCQLQQLEYPRQVEIKRGILEEILRHRFPEAAELPVMMLACAQPFGYRSRARVQMRGAGERAIVGFYRHRSHAIEDVEQCPLLRSSLNEALATLRQYKKKVDMDPTPMEMDMACSEEEGTWATARVGCEPTNGGIPLLGQSRLNEVLLKRQVGGFVYSLTAASFFQANDFIVDKLALLIQGLFKGRGDRTALDLFSGVGLFTLPLARQFARVVAVESSPEAARLCRGNAHVAGLQNVDVVCADAASWVTSGEIAPDEIDLVVLDPPRTGAGRVVMEQVRRIAPPTVLYVSCDPQTLARDLAFLAPREYRIDFIQGLDMFPQTYHFETVVRLIRNRRQTSAEG